MKFSIGYNWQYDLIEGLTPDNIEEFYGKLDSDTVGGGRPAVACSHIAKSEAASHIKGIHNKGFEFNYLLNSMCLYEGNFSKDARLRSLLEWLKSSCVESLTVALPSLAKFIKSNYPGFKICVSTLAGVNSPQKARFWEGLGAEKITLAKFRVNRDFGLIRKIRKAVKCRLQLIANDGCLYDCPFSLNHGLFCSHASQESHPSGGFVADFYSLMCTYLKVSKPLNLIRADWIRPEDTLHYRDLGIDSVKLVDRGMATAFLRRVIEAYIHREYKGNLIDLFPHPSKNINFIKPELKYIFKFFLRPGMANIFRLKRISSILSRNLLYVDNPALDGFLLSLQDKKCDAVRCEDCGFCEETAKRAIRAVNGKDNYLREIEEVIEDFKSGKLFTYL
ncbi:MAG: hypothetical protein GF375_03195 [Candidatus Omnitrophica bacterium]|nr:hypothetical protein [Candidatus Omnitrophota bacterium]MBD3269089.1 hypothetical protein [Candidatus Omnitrophota bacterium]